MIREGELSSEALVETLLTRIEETNDRVKAYITVCRDSALKEARKADVRLRQKRKLGPLHGVPVSVKDLIETRGVRTTAGSRLLSTYVPGRERSGGGAAKAAGAIVLGKTNTHEFALGGELASHLQPLEPGQDPGRLERGVPLRRSPQDPHSPPRFGYGRLDKDTRFVLWRRGSEAHLRQGEPAGVFPESWSLDHVGPITKTVQDCALILGVIAGRDPLDGTTSSRSVPNYLSDLDPSIEGVRVGVPDNYFFEPMEKGVRSAVGRAIKKLAGLGERFSTFTFPWLMRSSGRTPSSTSPSPRPITKTPSGSGRRLTSLTSGPSSSRAS